MRGEIVYQNLSVIVSLSVIYDTGKVCPKCDANQKIL